MGDSRKSGQKAAGLALVALSACVVLGVLPKASEIQSLYSPAATSVTTRVVPQTILGRPPLTSGRQARIEANLVDPQAGDDLEFLSQTEQVSRSPGRIWSLALIPISAIVAYFAAKNSRRPAIEPLDLVGPYQYTTYTMLSTAGAPAAEEDAKESKEEAQEAAPAPKKQVVVEKSYAKIIENIDKKHMKPDVPDVQVGDTVVVGVRIREGEKERIQDFEGVIIAINNRGLNKCITVRAVLQGVGVERGFPLHAPQVAYIKILKRAKVRRAKLYYLRGRSGKAARLKIRTDKPKVAKP